MYIPESEIEELWRLVAITRNGIPSNFWGKDFAGAWIRKDQLGKRTQYGWDIDHIKPRIMGGTDDIDNLQAIHWRNNIIKGDHYPDFSSCITSSGEQNIIKEQRWHVAQ